MTLEAEDFYKTHFPCNGHFVLYLSAADWSSFPSIAEGSCRSHALESGEGLAQEAREERVGSLRRKDLTVVH